MKKAANEFEVPTRTNIIMMFPKVMDRDILLKHNNFCFESTKMTRATNKLESKHGARGVRQTNLSS
jgi:hypothetical protein